MESSQSFQPLYSTLQYTTLHYTTLHYTTLHYTTLHYTTLLNTTLHYTTSAMSLYLYIQYLTLNNCQFKYKYSRTKIFCTAFSLFHILMVIFLIFDPNINFPSYLFCLHSIPICYFYFILFDSDKLNSFAFVFFPSHSFQIFSTNYTLFSNWHDMMLCDNRLTVRVILFAHY